jgi:methionyl aminopeptidase
MISIKNNTQIQLMRDAGIITKDTLELVAEHIKEGITTYELDKIAHDYIIKQNSVPSFLNYEGYPATLCVSINEEVVHGIPSKKRIIKNGDIVSIDCGACFKGYHSDAARTIPVGNVDSEMLRLIEVTKQSFFEGIKVLKDGVRMGDLSGHIQQYIESNGFAVIRDLIGHGVGTTVHEEPDVPNYGQIGHGIRLYEGMTIAIEPMVAMGTWKVRVLDNGWTFVTMDGKPSAHYENTVLITKDGAEILSL